MTTRSSYTYNPDLPIRKWHQKWINPVISLQNAPPATHGTPAPTKEDGDVAAAGFKVKAWIPLDEDDDVTDEILQQEVDWWSKPGAPVRPELRESQQRAASTVPMEVESTKEKEGEKETQDVVMTDAPEPGARVNGVAEPDAVATSTEAMEEVTTSPPKTSPKQEETDTTMTANADADAEMADAEPSPVHLTSIRSRSPSPTKPAPHPAQAQVVSPNPISKDPNSPLPPHAEPSAAARSPSKSTPTEPMLEDILPPSKPSPSDPVGQAEEVAAGLAPELPEEKAGHVSDPGNLSGVGGGIAGEGIAGGRDMDLPDIEEMNKEDSGRDGRTEEEQEIINASKKDLDTEIVKDPET